MLEKWAKALDVELYQLFFAGAEKPEAPEVLERIFLRPQERSLVRTLSTTEPWTQIVGSILGVRHGEAHGQT
jgi:hypothetical protein